jgi:hypothetical protein
LEAFLTFKQVLAIGFLLVILSAALFHQYLTLLVVATYVLAPFPNWICARCANPDDFMESAGNAVIDFGRFCTGFLVVMGIGTNPRPEHISDAEHQLTITDSLTCPAGTLCLNRSSRDVDVDCWRPSHIRNHYQLYAVL